MCYFCCFLHITSNRCRCLDVHCVSHKRDACFLRCYALIVVHHICATDRCTREDRRAFGVTVIWKAIHHAYQICPILHSPRDASTDFDHNLILCSCPVSQLCSFLPPGQTEKYFPQKEWFAWDFSSKRSGDKLQI